MADAALVQAGEKRRRDQEESNKKASEKRQRKQEAMLELALLVEEARKEGWENITDEKIKWKGAPQLSGCSYIPGSAASRQQLKPGKFFEVLLTDIVAHIATQTTLNYHLKRNLSPKHSRSGRLVFGTAQIWKYVAACLKACSGDIPKGRWDVWMRTNGPTQLQLPRRCFENVRHFLDFDYFEVINHFNRALARTIKLGGFAAGDEQIINWDGMSEYLICIPRKPNPIGIRNDALIAELTVTRLPVMIRILPGLVKPPFPPDELLQFFVRHDQVATSEFVLFCDSYYGTVRWMETHQEHSLVFALAENRVPFYKLFQHDMKPKQYRQFRKGSLILSLYSDKKLMVCVSNSHVVDNSTSQALRQGADASNLPTLSNTCVESLLNWSCNDLRSFGAILGKPFENLSKNEMVARLTRTAVGSEAKSQEIAEVKQNDGLGERINHLINSRTAKELQGMCKELRLKASGTKAELARRVATKEMNITDEEQNINRVKNYLGPSRLMRGQDLPTLNSSYHAHFNCVDRFDQALAGVAYPFKIEAERHRLFIWFVEISIVQAYNVCYDYLTQIHGENVEKREEFGFLSTRRDFANYLAEYVCNLP